MRVMQEGHALYLTILRYGTSNWYLGRQPDLGDPVEEAELVIDCRSGDAVQLTTFLLALT